MPYCPKCDADVDGREECQVDCDSCIGTGIGYNHESNSCGHCGGRGYIIVHTYIVCDICDEYLED